MATATLYRPVGQPELDLIEASGWRRFPPRLPEQPISYPVTTEAYATRIASEWNTADEANGGVGHVLHFPVDADVLAAYPEQEAGGRDLREHRVPAEELDAFNDHLVGTIEVIAEWRGRPPVRVRRSPASGVLRRWRRGASRRR